MTIKNFDPLYTTNYGALYCADSLSVMEAVEDESVDLVMTSPLYALHFKNVCIAL